MADKQIRITTDTSAIERFKVEADEMYRNLRKYSKDYLTASEQDIDAIMQKHQELANVYRELNIAETSKSGDRAFQRLDYQFTENNINRNKYQEQHPQVDMDSNSRKSILEQIRDVLNKIFNEKQTVGGRTLNAEDDTDPFRRLHQQDTKETQNNTRKMDVMGGLADIASGNFAGGVGKLLGVASIGAGVGGLISSWQALSANSAEQYRADSDISRDIVRRRRFQMLDITGARRRNMDESEENISAYENSLESQYHTAVMYGTGIDSSIYYMARGAASHNTPVKGSWGRILGQAATMAGSGALIGGGVGSLGAGVGAVPGAAVGGFAGFLVGGASGAYNEFNTNKSANREFRTRGSNVLGKDISEMADDLYAYRRAAVNNRNGSNDSIWQSMLAEKTFDLDRNVLLGLYSANRYQRGSVGVDKVASDLTYTLAPKVSDPMELATRLNEDLRAYTQVANTAREKGGGEFDSNRIKEIVQALQTKGLEGDNLTSLAQSIAGHTMSGSDMSRAMLMQAATMSGKGGTLLDIQAELENPSSDVMKTLAENIWNMSGGNKDVFETTFASSLGISASRMRNLRNNGLLYDKNGNFDWDSFSRSDIKGEAFNEEDAASKVTDVERSKAGTTNKKILAGSVQAKTFYEGDEDWFKAHSQEMETKVQALIDRLNQPLETTPVFKAGQQPKVNVITNRR